jgi:hypothetical protein
MRVASSGWGAVDLGSAANCQNLFCAIGESTSIFYTYYNLASCTGFEFERNSPIAKFPAPVTASNLIQARGPVVQGYTYSAAQFTSSETSVQRNLHERAGTFSHRRYYF